MSRNFELLQQAEQGMISNAAADPAPSSEPAVWTATPAETTEAPVASLPYMEDRSREEMSKLVRQLFQSPGGGRAVVLASVEPGNGGTWMTVNCARLLAAQARGPVCVVDGNLRTPALHGQFGVTNHHGLSDLMRQGGSISDYVQRLEGTRNLWLLSCGSEVGREGPGVLLSLETLRARMQELRAGFEYVVIDAPALSQYGDAVILGQAADGVALVIAEQNTRKESARHAVDELNKANVRVLGAVLNKRTFPIPQKIYDRL
ncbi:MAG TPA: CpsD/CapB family tyrosine-protein kinase [Verrucomicrobiae bacterium]|nr:CpsD/CapB family tyrosine-protein kinase [Verrucomicrobiae bacterium]